MIHTENKPRVVITGVGACTPIGIGVDRFWRNALAGVDGLKPIVGFDHSQLRTHVGGEIHDFDARAFLSAEQLGESGRAAQLAIASARMALDDALLDASALGRYAAHRRAVSFGTTMGEPGLLDELVDDIESQGYADFAAQRLFRMPSFRISDHLAQAFEFQGVNYQIPTACTAGNSAIGYGADLLRTGRADLVLVGGADAFSRMAHVGFNRLLAVTPDRVAPFDLNRSGMAVGEGSGALILERIDDALDRGATVLAEFVDYGLGCDAHKLTIPHPQGRGGKIAFRQALQRSSLSADRIEYISAHGTGTRENDRVETQIIKEVLGPGAAARVKVSSIKSMIGHTMGAASALEAIVCVLALRHGWLPPTINHQTPDPECDLDIVPNQARQTTIEVAASNAYAFGGNCSTIVLRRPPNQPDLPTGTPNDTAS